MRKCEICGESWDEQFISQYERTEITGNTRYHNVIHVCEECDHPGYDEETGNYYITVDGVRWHN